MLSDEQIVELLKQSDEHFDRPVVTSSDVADYAGIARQTAHRHLDRLHEEGEVRKYKPGRSAVWWIEN